MAGTLALKELLAVSALLFGQPAAPAAQRFAGALLAALERPAASAQAAPSVRPAFLPAALPLRGGPVVILPK